MIEDTSIVPICQSCEATQPWIVQGYDDTLTKDLLYEGPILLMFTATWCNPCQKMKPLIRQLAEEYAGKLKVIFADVEVSQKFSQSYEITALPTILVGRGGTAGKFDEIFMGLVNIEKIRESITNVK